MTLHGLFSRSQRTERSVLPYAQLNEKTFWRQPRGPTVPRFKQVIALQNSDDLKVILTATRIILSEMCSTHYRAVCCG